MNSEPNSDLLKENISRPNQGPGNDGLFNLNDPLLDDPDYQNLLLHSQNGEWDQCLQLLDMLLKKYPDHPKLNEIRADVELQNMKQHMKTDPEEEHPWKDRLRGILRYALYLLGVILVIGGITAAVFYNYRSNLLAANAVEQQQNLESLKELERQANVAVQLGNVELLSEITQKMEALDPGFAPLAQLKDSAAELVFFKQEYDRAAVLAAGGEKEEALAALQQIEQKRAGLWDVRSLIDQLDSETRVKAFLAEADQAYEDQDWEGVITAIESALALDKSIQSNKVTQQLLDSYLRDVIEILSKEKPTEEDLTRAETNYRNASALIPQSKTFIEERENLRQVSLQLLILNYTQAAEKTMQDPNNSERSVNLAVNYLAHALELTPTSTQLSRALEKARQYQVGLQSFNAGQWDEAISQFQAIAYKDSQYPNGMVPQYLYEAYTALGLKYYRAGFYLDARKNFEAAEVLAWQEKDNPLRKFEAELNIARSVGKLDSYKDAASYFKYAMESIKIDPKVENARELTTSLNQAASLFNEGNYFEAYQKYLQTVENVDRLYHTEQIHIRSGTSLITIASNYHSTIQAIREANDLTEARTIKFDQDLIIPTLP